MNETAVYGPVRLRDLVALSKPSVTLLVIITTAGGLWLAPGTLSLLTLVATLVGTVLIVASANTLNCWLERDSDRHMSRTRNRPLPAGRLDPKVALIFGFVLAVVSIPILAVYVNPLTAILAALALVSYVGLYTPLKRIGPVALIVGSFPGAMPPLMGWTAVTGGAEWPGLVLFGILFVWQIPHFLAIALYREEEYARAGIKTLPNVRGARVTKWHALLWSFALVPVSLALYPLGIAGPIYAATAVALDVGFLAFAFAGFRARSDEVWARSFFLYTLLYLTVLFAVLVIDAGPVHGA